MEGAEERILKAQLLYTKEPRICSACGKEVYSQSNHAKYCAVCAATAKRAQKAAYARKQRAKVEK
jgi:predicted amidophosphoribosyltransferase